MSGTRDNTRNDRATAYLNRLFAERIDINAVIESAKNLSETSSSSQNGDVLPPIEFKFTPLIAPPVFTSENKQKIVALIQHAKSAVSSKKLDLATTLLGPTILKTTNETNHLIDIQRKAAVKHQIEFALTNTVLNIFENHFIEKQKALLKLTYQTSNGTALVKLLDSKKTAATKKDIEAAKSERNKIISTTAQEKIISDFYDSLPEDEIKDIVARVNNQMQGFIPPSSSKSEIKEKVCFVLREKWLSIEYLSPITKEHLLAKATSALKDAKADILAALIQMIEATLKSEKHDINDAAIHNIRNELVKYTDELITSTLNDVKNTIDADGNKTAKGALLDLHEKANTLKSTCALNTKKTKELMDTYENKSTRLKNEFLKDESTKALLKPLSLTPQDIIDAKIGEINFAEWEKMQFNPDNTDTEVSLENFLEGVESSKMEVSTDVKQLKINEDPSIALINLACVELNKILVKMQNYTNYFTLINRLIVNGQTNFDLQSIVDEMPSLALHDIDTLISHIYLTLENLFAQKALLGQSDSNTLNQIKSLKDAHKNTPTPFSALKREYLQSHINNIAIIMGISASTLNNQNALLIEAHSPSTMLSPTRMYWSAVGTSLLSMFKRESAVRDNLPMLSSATNPEQSRLLQQGSRH